MGPHVFGEYNIPSDCQGPRAWDGDPWLGRPRETGAACLSTRSFPGWPSLGSSSISQDEMSSEKQKPVGRWKMDQEFPVNYLNYGKKKNRNILEPFLELIVKKIALFLLEQRQWVCFSL